MTSKLDSIENVDAKLSAWIEGGYSLMRVVAEIGKLGVTVTDMTVQRRIRSLGLATKNVPIAQRTGEGAWLSQYREEIVGFADSGCKYSEIWDRLAAAHPAQPRFQRDLSRDAKTAAIAAWVHAERKRNARQRRASLLDALPAAGAVAPQYVVMQAPAGAAKRPRQAVSSVGQMVRPVPVVPVAPATGEPRFDIEARRRETQALQQSQRAQEDAATTAEQKAKAAKLLERFKTP